MFVAVDKKRIFSVKMVMPVSIDKPSKGVLGYILYGGICEFQILAERCVEIDNEYAVILNMEGYVKAKNWAINRGYIGQYE